jgi:hypothetical protein
VRKSHGVVLAAAAVAALAVWLAPVSTAQTQIQLTFAEGPVTRYVDVGRPDVSPGDQYLERHALSEAATGEEAGTIVTRFEVVTVHRGAEGDLSFIIDGTLRLAEGDIAFYGTDRYSNVFATTGVTFPVIGGSGSFAGMAGTLHIVAAEPGVFMVTVDLSS